MNTVLMPALIFLLANALILLAVLALNRREGRRKGNPTIALAEKTGDSRPAGGAGQGEQSHRREGVLPPVDILAWEFEYARATASEAMQDRLTMVNFYLLATGVIASGVVFALGKDSNLPGSLSASLGTVLLWLLCGIGWIHFLKVIRLRQAWHDSARTMNQIKKFYTENVQGIDPDLLRTAFRWRPETLPAAGKPWTVFFYSSVLIAFLDSAAYVAGAVLLDPQTAFHPPWAGATLLLLGLAFFALHIGLYFAFLSPGKEK